jgi:hypothetical protein
MMEVKMLNCIIYVLKNMEKGLFGHRNEFLECAFEMTINPLTNQVICVDHGTLQEFCNSKFFWTGVLSPTPNPQPGG